MTAVHRHYPPAEQAGWSGNFMAFGVPLQSRYGEIGEALEMLAFASLAARTGVAGYIASVFYDSKSCCCHIELKEESLHLFDVQDIIEWCGNHTLSNFTVDDGLICGNLQNRFRCGFCGSPGDPYMDFAVSALSALATGELRGAGG